MTTGQTVCGGIAATTNPNNRFGYGRIDVLAAANLPLLSEHIYVSATALNRNP